MNARYLVLIALVVLAALLGGCSLDPPYTPKTDENEVVSIPQTEADRLSIGGSWLYAHATWIESMHQKVAEDALDISEAYWSYWYWFEQIAYGYATRVTAGGNWATANCVVRRYGFVREADFVLAGSRGTRDDSAMALRHREALGAINESLLGGLLSAATRRRDKRLVRAELDRVWGLSPEQRAMLDRVFGEDVDRTFATSADATGSPIVRPQDFPVGYASGRGRPLTTKTLARAADEWRQVYYAPLARADLLLRLSDARRDGQPVIVTWFVDFNAMESHEKSRLGSFSLATLRELGPGRQGGHTTVLDSYEPSRFLRVKSAWGAAHPAPVEAVSGLEHHDLYLDYLDGPIKRCVDRDGETDTSNCPFDYTPLQNVVLPPGY